MKKIYKIILKKFSIFFVSNLSKFLSFFNLKIIPSHDEKTKYTFEYSKDTRRFIYKPSKDLFSKLIIDTSHFVSDLCINGAYYRTNKSAFNNFGHRSGYTPYYDIIFRHLKTHWAGGPSPENGAYGLYPVQCKNVLIENCIAIAASDAGIYVGAFSTAVDLQDQEQVSVVLNNKALAATRIQTV